MDISVSIRALDDTADRGRFTCGVEALDGWLRRQAGQAQRRRLASVWVASPKTRPETLLGYYSLAPWQVAFEECAEKLRRGLPRYPVPVTLIARLAVAASEQGKGLGGILLVDALRRAHSASESVPVHAVLVHAKDESAAGFYGHYGFLPFPRQRFWLYLPMGSVNALIAGR